MKFFSASCLYRYGITITLLFLISQFARAQSESDAIMIPQHYFCAGTMYSNSNWTKYWEGTFKRTNGNIGQLNSNMYSLMGNYGITSRLNILATVPYVTTHASQGTLNGQKGFQDMMLTVKWMPLRDVFGSSVFKLFTIASVSIPLSNYEANFLPMSIGIHSKSAMLRILADYHTGNFFATSSAQYIRRSNITIDQNAYYSTQMFYTNQVAIADGSSFNFRSGYRSNRLIAEAIIEDNTTLGGFDIRKNDMPFPGNKMNSTMVGLNVKYSFSAISGLELTGGADYVIAGRNVGQSSIIHGGAYYLFDLVKKK